MWLTAHSQWTAKWLLKVVNDWHITQQSKTKVCFIWCAWLRRRRWWEHLYERNLRDIIKKNLYTRMNEDVVFWTSSVLKRTSNNLYEVRTPREGIYLKKRLFILRKCLPPALMNQKSAMKENSLIVKSMWPQHTTGYNSSLLWSFCWKLITMM